MPIKITLNTELDKMHILNMAYKLKIQNIAEFEFNMNLLLNN